MPGFHLTFFIRAGMSLLNLVAEFKTVLIINLTKILHVHSFGVAIYFCTKKKAILGLKRVSNIFCL